MEQGTEQGASYTPRLGGLEPMNRCYRRGRLRLGGMAGIFCHLLMAGIVAGQHQGEQHAWAADFPARQGLISLCVDATNENKTVLPKYRYSMQTLDFALLEMNKTPVRSRPVILPEVDILQHGFDTDTFYCLPGGLMDPRGLETKVIPEEQFGQKDVCPLDEEEDLTQIIPEVNMLQHEFAKDASLPDGPMDLGRPGVRTILEEPIGQEYVSQFAGIPMTQVNDRSHLHNAGTLVPAERAAGQQWAEVLEVCVSVAMLAFIGAAFLANKERENLAAHARIEVRFRQERKEALKKLEISKTAAWSINASSLCRNNSRLEKERNTALGTVGELSSGTSYLKDQLESQGRLLKDTQHRDQLSLEKLKQAEAEAAHKDRDAAARDTRLRNALQSLDKKTKTALRDANKKASSAVTALKKEQHDSSVNRAKSNKREAGLERKLTASNKGKEKAQAARVQLEKDSKVKAAEQRGEIVALKRRLAGAERGWNATREELKEAVKRAEAEANAAKMAGGKGVSDDSSAGTSAFTLRCRESSCQIDPRARHFFHGSGADRTYWCPGCYINLKDGVVAVIRGIPVLKKALKRNDGDTGAERARPWTLENLPRFVGLDNPKYSNRCPLIATGQILRHWEGFREMSLKANRLYMEEGGGKKRSYMAMWGKLFEFMQEGTKNGNPPGLHDGFAKRIGMTDLQNHRQADASEVLGRILETIETEAKEPANQYMKTLLNECTGETLPKSRCGCGNVRTHPKDSFVVLTLSVEAMDDVKKGDSKGEGGGDTPAPSIPDLLKKYFDGQGALGACNACKRTGKDNETLMRPALTKAPSKLFLRINRAGYDREKRAAVKIHDKVDIPMVLDMGMYMAGKKGRALYDVDSTVHHLGEEQGSGHYTSYARVEGNEWCCYNDANATTVGMDKALSNTAYIISYTLQQ